MKDSVTTAGPVSDHPRTGLLTVLKDVAPRYGTVVGVIVLAGIFAVATSGRFLSVDNTLTILKQGSILTVMAVGLTVPLILGDFDLSFSFLATFGGILSVGLMANNGLPVALAIAIVLVIAVVIGWLNGFITTRWNVHSLVATLGMSSIITGFIYLYSGGNQIASGIPRTFLYLGRGQLFGIPAPVIIALAVVVIMWIVMEHTIPGRRMYAVGGNAQAAFLSGINIARYRRVGFIICAVGAVIGGMVLTSLLSVGHPTAANGMMLDAFTAAFLGAVTIKRGEFNIPGTFVGVVFLSVIVNGLTMMGADFWVQNVVKGVVLIIAVAASGSSRKFGV